MGAGSPCLLLLLGMPLARTSLELIALDEEEDDDDDFEEEDDEEDLDAAFARAFCLLRAASCRCKMEYPRYAMNTRNISGGVKSGMPVEVAPLSPEAAAPHAPAPCCERSA